MFTDADIIHKYTRGDAIDDGVLIDVSDTAKEAGLKYPTAITSAAWTAAVHWDPAADRRKGGCHQDEAGRLWDVVWMLRTRIGQLNQIARTRNDPNPIRELEFQFYCVPYEGRARTPRLSTLKACVGPGDAAKLSRTQIDTLRSHAEACLLEIDEKPGKRGNAERFALLLADVMWKAKDLGVPYHHMTTKSAAAARAIAFTSALSKKEAEWNTPTVKVTCQVLGARHTMGAIAEWLKADHGYKNLELMAVGAQSS